MKLWLLRPVEGLDPNPWDPWYDKCFGQVIRAESELRARQIAIEGFGTGDEGKDVWLDPEKVTCEPLTEDGPEERIMRDFASA